MRGLIHAGSVLLPRPWNTSSRLDTAPVNWQDHEMRSMSVRPLLLALAAASLVIAQTSTAPIGTPRRTVWDGAYTEAQATRGAMTFAQSCAGCHALGAQGKAPIAGEAFWKSFAQKNVGDLVEFVSKYMPNGAPGSLSESAYNDVVAVILKTNGFPAGTTELARNINTDVQILPKDGSTVLPADTLIRVVGCLARSGSDWVVTSATTPERAEHPGGEDATRPLGSRTLCPQVRPDPARSVRRFPHRGQRAPDRSRRRRWHQCDHSDARRPQVSLNAQGS